MEPIHIIIDSETNTIQERPYNEKEMAEYQKSLIEVEKRTKEADRLQEIRQSALAKLTALGLTEEEIAAL